MHGSVCAFCGRAPSECVCQRVRARACSLCNARAMMNDLRCVRGRAGGTASSRVSASARAGARPALNAANGTEAPEATRRFNASHGRLPTACCGTPAQHLVPACPPAHLPTWGSAASKMSPAHERSIVISVRCALCSVSFPGCSAAPRHFVRASASARAHTRMSPAHCALLAPSLRRGEARRGVAMRCAADQDAEWDPRRAPLRVSG